MISLARRPRVPPEGHRDDAVSHPGPPWSACTGAAPSWPGRDRAGTGGAGRRGETAFGDD